MLPFKGYSQQTIIVITEDQTFSLFFLIGAFLGVESRSLSKLFKDSKAQKRSEGGCCGGDNAPSCCATSNELAACCDDKEDEEEDDEPSKINLISNI